MRIRRGIVFVAVAGCSSSSSAPDAPQPTTGQFVVSQLTILGQNDPNAFDLTGDSVPDNRLGILATDYSALFDLAIIDGGAIVLVEATDLPSPPLNGPITIAIYTGQDEDIPANPGDNFTGSEHFYIHPSSLDANGRPIIVGTGAIANGVVTIQPLPTLGAFGLHDVHMTGKIARDLSAVTDGVIGGWLAIGSLAGLKQQSMGLSALDLLVTHYLQQPDIDLDGDGLETLADTDGDGIVDKCVDGDGTIYTGVDCVLDPHIADAFSAAFGLAMVSCVIDPPCDPAAGPCPPTGGD